jgi:UDP-N-acetylglucosamine 4,6-dehydratase
MITADDSRNTLEYDDHYLITPSISFIVQGDYRQNGLGERGFPVAEGFKYASDTNSQFLDIAELRVLDALPP